MTGQRSVRYAVVASCLTLLASACSSGSPETDVMSATLHPTASSPSSSILPLPPGVQKDSIEDVNSTKDMTGIITTHSGDDNPYLKLLPPVCPFIPQSVADKLGTPRKRPQFDGKLLATCSMSGPFRAERSRLVRGDTLDAISLTTTRSDSRKHFTNPPVALPNGLTGYAYQMDDTTTDYAQRCSVVWGTFYGKATADATLFKKFPGDPCQLAAETARAIATLLPTKPIQMRN